jgi:hypothetical protein
MGVPDQQLPLLERKKTKTRIQKDKTNRPMPFVHTPTTVYGRCAPPDQRAPFHKSQAPNHSNDAAACQVLHLHVQMKQVENGTFSAIPAATPSQDLSPPSLPSSPPCQVPDEPMQGIRSNFDILDKLSLNRTPPQNELNRAGSGGKAKSAQILHRGDNDSGGLGAPAAIVKKASHKSTNEKKGFSTTKGSRLMDLELDQSSNRSETN